MRFVIELLCVYKKTNIIGLYRNILYIIIFLLVMPRIFVIYRCKSNSNYLVIEALSQLARILNTYIRKICTRNQSQSTCRKAQINRLVGQLNILKNTVVNEIFLTK